MCIAGEGPQDAEVIVIGEAPGREEDYHGRPFIGSSGRVLRGELAKAGFRSTYITNVVKCRPPNNRDPSPAEIKACRPYLDAELAAVRAKYILTVGRFSSKSVLKRSRITIDHGQVVDMVGGRRGMPVYHPAYTLRDPSKLPGLQQDLKRLRNIIDGVEIGKLPEWKKVDIDTSENLEEFLRAFQAAEEFSYDVETTGLFPYNRKGSIRCISIGLVGMSYVIPLEMPGSMFEGLYESQCTLIRILVAHARDKVAIAQNGKFDQHWLRLVYGYAFDLNFDTMLASHLIDENEDH